MAQVAQQGQAGKQKQLRELSARRIIGFACNQAFVLFLLYMGPFCVVQAGEVPLNRFDLLCTLLFMVVGFAAARALGPQHVHRIFSRPLMYVFAIVAAAGSLLSLVFPGNELQWLLAQGALTGVPIAYLLTAWGRTFGRQPIATSVPEVFLGTLVGAFVCLLFSLPEASQVATLAMRILPLASVVNIQVPPDEERRPPAVVEAGSGQARILSLKILAGTLLFGMAQGVFDACCLQEGADAALPYYAVSLVIFGAFLTGALSLQLSDGFGRGAALNKSYRLAVFIMLVGMLMVPLRLLEGSLLPGQAVVLAGYLGLEAVFIGLFIVMAKVTATDCALSFSVGFSSLFGGELVGALITDLALGANPGIDTGVLFALAGVVALLSYVFLFTERDFDELSQIVTASDTFEDVCARIVETYALSKRESEILAYALRGRTNERIAQELVIAKSTVDTHLRRIYSKCGVHSRQELLDLAEKTA